jgi:hypothetical protein
VKIPLILDFAVFAQGLPVLAAMTRHRRITGARLVIVEWCLLLLFMDLIGGYFGRIRHMNNHFLTYIFTPLQGITIMWALSLWQVKPVARMTIRLAIPPFLAAWVLLSLFVEETDNFSPIGEPVYSLLALGAAVFTLLSRSGGETEPLPQQDWFWICIGLILYFGLLVVLTPLGAAFSTSNPMLVYHAYIVRAWVNIAAFTMISIGMLCPPRP